jgi:hypothetical protein
MANKPGTTITSGVTEVAEAGKPVKITSTVGALPAIGIWLNADTGNAGNVVIGDKEVKAKTKEQRGTTLVKATSPIFIEISDPTLLFADVETSKDKVAWLVVTA